jgi:hypothetical protein
MDAKVFSEKCKANDKAYSIIPIWALGSTLIFGDK